MNVRTQSRVRSRVIVVGNGMVGSRFVDDLLQRDGDSFEITVLGAEEYEPYNRVLLSDVVAGRADVATITLPSQQAAHTAVRRGAAVVGIDRDARCVMTDDGSLHPYDALVLATGSAARVPDVPGLAPLPGGVHALRTLDDAREIVAASMNARSAVVVGGGVLGVEAALGLARRGVPVTLVHGADALMERQLDDGAGGVLAGELAGLGVTCRTGARPSQVLVGDEDGRVSGVRLDGRTNAPGEIVDADLVVLACGTVPETQIAAQAGLAVERGVVVGHDLSTDDPQIFAIGDCAQPPEGSQGLVAEGWDQSRRLAQHLVSLVVRQEPTEAPEARTRSTTGPPRTRPPPRRRGSTCASRAPRAGRAWRRASVRRWSRAPPVTRASPPAERTSSRSRARSRW
ncbi:hypothetical protein GCM10025865_07870 [Paraoerskovia sediminicola]|uniref:FAD/NAD(P)-binding domain-containing protein n=1 Tax=Paraoerskovia sediminicola TaxID=1138587 RepID=A0ABM8G0A3_9CELL|nr:FAD-dependent oxidoreductase [Paraoerskovia sediminicola]BDZ41488.1 hypothetical protein GCM10025865_07870 [Paraoerskovia sediminicola]